MTLSEQIAALHLLAIDLAEDGGDWQRSMSLCGEVADQLKALAALGPRIEERLPMDEYSDCGVCGGTDESRGDPTIHAADCWLRDLLAVISEAR